MVVEGEGAVNSMPADQGETEAIDKANGLISVFFKQVDSSRLIFHGCSQDGQLIPPAKETCGLDRGGGADIPRKKSLVTIRSLDAFSFAQTLAAGS
jgi:hypothetical protein